MSVMIIYTLSMHFGECRLRIITNIEYNIVLIVSLLAHSIITVSVKSIYFLLFYMTFGIGLVQSN